MLPYDPKPDAEHVRRYDKAVERLFMLEDIERGGLRPGECPENVFDFSDGLRLIISREDWGSRGKHLHLSASAHEGTPIVERVRARQLTLTDFLNLCAGRAVMIGGSVPWIFGGFSQGKSVPHWLHRLGD